MSASKTTMPTIYGLIYEHLSDEEILHTPVYVVPLQIVDVVKNETNCPPGMYFLKVIFTSEAPVPALGISTAQKLSFGREVPIGAELGTLLPHSTGLWGFCEIETGRIVGNGRFFETLAEAEASAQREDGMVVNLLHAR